MQQKKDEMAELREQIYRYLRAWRWFAVSVVGFLALAVLYIKLASPVYQVNANVLVKEDDKGGAAKGAALMRSMGVGFPGSMEVQDELYTLSSFSLMRQAMDSLKLYTSYEQVKFPFNKELYGDLPIRLEIPQAIIDTLEAGLRFTVKIDEKGLADIKVKGKGYKLSLEDKSFPVSIDTKYGTFTLVKGDAFEEGKAAKYKISLSGLAEAAEDYLKIIDISLADKKANVLALSIKGTNPQKLKDLLNTLIALYNADASEEKSELTKNTADFIKKRLDVLNVELAQAEDEVEAFKKANKLVNLDYEAKAMLEQSGDLRAKLIEVTSQLSILEEAERSLKAQTTSYELLPVSVGGDNEGVVADIMEYNKLVLQYQRLGQTTNTDNPVMVSLRADIAAKRKNVLASLRNTCSSLAIAKKDLENQMNQFTGRFADAPTIEKNYVVIKRNQLIKEGLVVFLMEKGEENALSASLFTSKARIIDAAYKMTKPVWPKKLIILAVALFLGLVAPIVVLYLKDILVRTFTGKDEVEKISNLAVIGEVSLAEEDDKSGSAIVIRKESVTPVAELFRLIRTNLQFILTKRDEKVILVTSTQGGEGKSFVSVNLAASLALMGRKVVVVGLDIRKPMLAAYLKLSNAQGVTNFLASEDMTLDRVVTHNVDGHEGLDVIVAGPIPPNPGELMLSDRMAQLFAQLKERYDYVVVDSAPVGMVSDSFTLAPYSDMTLYVVRANYTDKSSLDYIETIQRNERLKKVYVVVNGVNIKKRAGYGYGYGYGVKSK
jgi:capsular exopolysaccharide synthesis family protein